MKRLLSLIIAMFMMLTMVACGNQSDEGGETPNVDNSQTQSQTENDTTKDEPSNDNKVTLAQLIKCLAKISQLMSLIIKKSTKVLLSFI